MEGVALGDAECRVILALNCGSSSLKFGVYRETAANPELLCEGEAEEIGKPNGHFRFQHGDAKVEDNTVYSDHGSALAHALDLLGEQGIRDFWRVGHRVVHGGPKVREHQALTADVWNELTAAVPFAPLHLPASLAVIQAVKEKMPETTQIVCLDTAFHRTMPDVARTLGLPADVRRQGVERYGFHGLSLESILAQLQATPQKLVVAHLGNGSSISAIRDGSSMDTTMGLTPTGGVMMGTRSGDLDPGVMVFLTRHGFAQADQLETLVNQKSGLLGVSGTSSDVRQLMANRGNADVDLALRLFCYQVRKAIAGMAAALGGMDLLVFTGGIGEHAAELRREIYEPLGWLGTFETKVLPAQEDLQIARTALRLG